MFLSKKARSTCVFVLFILALSLNNNSSFATPPQAKNQATDRCETVLTKQVKTLDELLWAFATGLVPNLKKAAQKDGFEIYRKLRFGNPNTHLDSNTIERVADAIKSNPDLTKEAFKNYEIEVQEKSYPVTKELQALVDTLSRSAGQTRGSLFQMEANLGYWKKMLQYEEPLVNLDGKTKKEKKKIKEQEKEKLTVYISEFISPETQKAMADEKLNAKVKAKALFSELNKAREKLHALQKDTRVISQSIVDLVHTIGFSEKQVTDGLKSKDGYERIQAIRRVISVRDEFAMELGFDGHFDELLSQLGIKTPSGIRSAETLGGTLSQIEADTLSKAVIKKNKRSSQTIRHLSIVESPFRSCLGGSDCSSRTYLTKALDPNYHYFTLTDSSGYSSGHITVVLGEAKLHSTKKAEGFFRRIFNSSKDKKAMVAFIDKIQNVPDRDLPIMIEGVRQSMLEKGYVLSLPENIGDNNGISNDGSTRDFVKKNIQVSADDLFVGYKPHSTKYRFENQYSRANQGLSMRPIKELSLSSHIQIQAGSTHEPWKIKDLDLGELVQASIALKDGSVDDKMRYIPAMQAIKVAGLTGDPAFKDTLNGWLTNPKEDFKLRKQVLLHLWLEEKAPLAGLLESFLPDARINLVQNFLDTPRYKEQIFKRKSDLPKLIVQVKDNVKIRAPLIEKFSSNSSKFISKILDSKMSEDKMVQAVEKTPSALKSVKIKDLAQFESFFDGTELEAQVKDILVKEFLNRVFVESILLSELQESLGSQNKSENDFALRILDVKSHPRLAEFQNAINSMKRIDLEHKGDIVVWLKDENTSSQEKADFLASKELSHPEEFKSLLSEIDPTSKKLVLKEIKKQSTLSLFKKAAKENGISEEVFDVADPKSFKFVKISFPEKGRIFTIGSPENEPNRYRDRKYQKDVILTGDIEIMATKFTQAQEFILTGQNQSYYKTKEFSDGDYTKIGDVEMNANHPAEMLSYDYSKDVIVKKLNQMQNEYIYFIPTDAQGEVFTRAGTETAYSYGDNPNELSDYAWSNENSGNRTHAVAMKKPNAAGLYDVHGNVWEWRADWYAHNPSGGLNPSGPESGLLRVLRGGCWSADARRLRSAYRSNGSPSARHKGVGLRLARTKRNP